MLAAQSIQVLPAVTDRANLYVGLNLTTAGRTTSTFSSPALTFNPSGNLLTVANISVSSSLGLGTSGGILADATTGALGLVPSATTAYPNPQALMVLPTGGLAIATTSGGRITAASYSTAITNAAATGPTIGSLVKVYNFISSVTIGAGTVRWYPQSGVNLIMAYLTAGTAPSIGNFQITLNKNGVAVQTITLTSGSFNTSPVILNTTATATDYFTVDVVSTGAASNGALNIVYQRTS
jgi:hypothetical protein